MSLVLRARKATRWIQRRIVPELRYSQVHFEEYLRARAAGAQAWLDIGCGHQLLSEWRFDAEKAMLEGVPLVVGIDYDFDSLLKHRSIHNVARADARRLPFPDRSFDLVTANMVVEHLDDPATQFAEIGRVLRPGGRFTFHTPNAGSYIVAGARIFSDSAKKRLARVLEGREEGDVFPTHYLANRLDDIRRVAATAGLEVEAVDFVSTVPVTTNFPPIALFELLFLRVLQRPSMAGYRSNIICTLRRRAG
jgi:SAM-dependent methyltransferase